MNAAALHDWAMLGVIILGGILVLAVIVFLWQAQHSPTSPFDAATMLQDERGKTSGPRLVYLIGAFAGIWVLIFMTIDRTMTAELVGVILGILMLGKVGSQYLDTKGAPPQQGSDVTTLTDVVPASDPRMRKKGD